MVVRNQDANHAAPCRRRVRRRSRAHAPCLLVRYDSDCIGLWRQTGAVRMGRGHGIAQRCRRRSRMCVNHNTGDGPSGCRRPLKRTSENRTGRMVPPRGCRSAGQEPGRSAGITWSAWLRHR
ncbi:30S ribosomal protein S1 [Ralstonia solanacearum]|nr:30S ribosomal protein S1 [Ralstonia solanacearum]